MKKRKETGGIRAVTGSMKCDMMMSNIYKKERPLRRFSANFLDSRGQVHEFCFPKSFPLRTNSDIGGPSRCKSFSLSVRRIYDKLADCSAAAAPNRRSTMQHRRRQRSLPLLGASGALFGISSAEGVLSLMLIRGVCQRHFIRF